MALTYDEVGIVYDQTGYTYDGAVYVAPEPEPETPPTGGYYPWKPERRPETIEASGTAVLGPVTAHATATVNKDANDLLVLELV